MIIPKEGYISKFDIVLRRHGAPDGFARTYMQYERGYLDWGWPSTDSEEYVWIRV